MLRQGLTGRFRLRPIDNSTIIGHGFKVRTILFSPLVKSVKLKIYNLFTEAIVVNVVILVLG